MWIDTTGDFSAENARQLLDCIKVIQLLMIQMSPYYHHYFQKPLSILERLQISLAFDIEAAQALVDHSIQNLDVRTISCPLASFTSRFSATLPVSGY